MVSRMEKKNENSTISSQQQGNYTSLLRLIASEHLTPEMAVNYLYQWRSHSKLIAPLLNRLYQICLKKFVHFIPTVIFIMSLENNQLFQKFCEKMANESLSHYLLVRWSYSTYMDSNKKIIDHIRTKLDSSLLHKNKQHHSLESINHQLQLKLQISNYTEHINLFFQKLFAFPQKLKKYEKSKRNIKLRQYLTKLSDKFMNSKIQYINGIAFPIHLSSNVVTKIVNEHCFTFSTKERVPFKIVVETISLSDALKLKNGQNPQYKEKSEEQIVEPQSFILPQTYFGKQWKTIKKQITSKSIFGNIKSYELNCFMVKSGDDLRQQYMAMQLIKLFHDIFQKQNLKIWIRPYSIIPYSPDSGLIQFINDTRTISFLKEVSQQKSLRTIYLQLFGSNWESSITNFIQSLAGYSLIQYFFDIKDRHNNNILVDVYGHIIHIDFSFMISSSPGNMNFQKAPFKLTQDYIEVMEGLDSDIFKHFKMLFFLGLKYLRKYKKQILQMIMMMTQCKGMKCFVKFDRQKLEKKFHENTTDQQLQKIVDYIIKDACNSYTTSQYDVYQWLTNKIYA